VGLSIYQGEFDFGVPQFRLLFAPVLIAVAASIALVLARILIGRGAALGAVAFFIGLRGILALLDSDHVGPMNIGNPNEFAVLELAELVIELTGSSSEIVYEPLPVDDPKQRCPDITLARTVLGWEPEVELREGLRRTAEWFSRG